MKRLFVLMNAVFLVCLLVPACTKGGKEISQGEKPNQVDRQGSQAPYKAPPEFFTGDVFVTPFFSNNETAQYYGAYVTFSPSARTAWHNHPAGQRLIVISGVCWTQEESGEKITAYPGDSVWCPAGVKHWHGASPDTEMTHLALSGISRKNVEWFEKVSDEIYLAGSAVQTTTIPDSNLSAKQQSIVAISAFTSRSDIDRLKAALNEGLDAGLTVNEIKEVLVHLYAYCGFPRSLNAITAFMGVIDEREKRGIKDPVGREASPLPAGYNSMTQGTAVQTELTGVPIKVPIYTFAPAIDEFLKGHLFGDIFARDVIGYQTRELATISALASVEGLGAQLAGHCNVGLNVGLTPENIQGVISILEMKAGKKEAAKASEVLQSVLSSRGLTK